MKAILRTILVVILIFLSIRTNNAQTKIYLPVILSDGKQVMEYPILSISNGTDTINFLDPGSGIRLADPYWTPNVAQLKGGGTFVNPSNAPGQALVSANYDNVVETIPLEIYAPEGYKTVERARKIFQMSVNAQQYYTASFEQNQVYFAVKPKGDNFLTGYAAVYTIALPNLQNPFGTPFNNDIDDSAFVDLSLIINREPFFSPLTPGEIIGPYFNMVGNGDFYHWTNGVFDMPPDLWTMFVADISTGTVELSTNTKFNNGNSLKIDVTDSTGAVEQYGIYQDLSDYLETEETYTFVAWIKNDGVVNGTAEIRFNDSFYLYQESTPHLWELHYKVFTEDELPSDQLDIVIQSNGANTDGTFYVDSLMILKGDWEDEINDNLIAWLSSSRVKNSFDADRENVTDESRINYMDMWNVPGDIEAPLNLYFQNTSDDTIVGGNPVGKLDRIAIGQKFELNQELFTPLLDYGGSPTADGADNTLLTTIALSDDWRNIGSYSLTDSEQVKGFNGYYKLELRLRDGSTSPLDVRVKWWVQNEGNAIYTQPISITTKGRLIGVNLTEDESINFVTKTKNISSLGFAIEARRTDGSSDTFQIDYALLIPLDNYVNVDMSVPLAINATLGLNSNDLSLYTTKGFSTQWTNIGAIEDFLSYSIYNNIAYMTMATFNGFDRAVVRLENDNLSLAYQAPQPQAIGFTPIVGPTFQGLLPIAEEGPVSLFDVYFSDGVTFPGTLKFSINDTIHSMTVQNNKLYIAGANFVQEWDGTTLTNLNRPTHGVYTLRMEQVISYKNNIYVAVRNAGVEDYNGFYRWDGGINWTMIFENDSGAAIPADVATYPRFTIFNNLLYFVDNYVTATKKPYIYSYDGNTATLVYDGSVFQKQVPCDLIFYNDDLYVSVYDATNVAIYKSTNNGVDFSFITYLGEGYNFAPYLFAYQGSLYDATSATLWSYSEQDTSIVYTQSDFVGNLNFTAQNRTLTDYKYQRILIKLLRSGNDDYLDDNGILSIGYRPRYKALINKDDF